jgi:hypothetical protein
VPSQAVLVSAEDDLAPDINIETKRSCFRRLPDRPSGVNAEPIDLWLRIRNWHGDFPDWL